MSFGSPEFFLRLKTEFYSDNNWEIHSLLDKEVRRVARFLARQAISDPQLRIDAIEDAVFRIFTYSIHKFLEDPAFETADERDRINWLYRAVGNAILDSLRRANVRSGVVLRGEDGEPLRIRHASLDQPDEDGFRLLDVLPGSDADPLERMALRQQALDALSALFSMDSFAPERLISAACVMLQEVYGFAFSKKQLNSAVAEALSGHTVSENLERVRRLLTALDLPESLLEPLERRISSDGTLMNLSARGVTKATSDIRVKLRRQFPDSNRVVPFSAATERMDDHD